VAMVLRLVYLTVLRVFGWSALLALLAQKYVRAGESLNVRRVAAQGREPLRDGPRHRPRPRLGWWAVVLLRLACLTVADTFVVVRVLAMTDREKDAGIVVLRHQFTVLGRWLDGAGVGFAGSDRALPALLHRLPGGVLRRMRLLVRPDTVLRWHRT
jgi:hypothetical protein